MQSTIPIRMQRLERLMEISRSLGRLISLQPAMDFIVEAARELTLSQAGSILVLEEETSLLKFIAAPQEHFERLKLVRVPLEGSIAGQCYQKGIPTLVRDTHDSQTIYRDVDILLGFKTQSVLAVPLIYHQQTIGVLEAVNKFNGGDYTQDDIFLMEALAAQAALVLENAILREKVQQVAAQMSELERMKSDFVAITSHELRTPLGLILGHASLLDETVSDTAQKAQLDVILKNATHLKKIIDDMTVVDKGQEDTDDLQRRRVSFNTLIELAAASYQQDAQSKRINLRTLLPKEDLKAVVDEEKIGIALKSLIQNGINFTPEGGQVLVKAETLSGYIHVSVIDTGIGIPREELHRIFERFYQVEGHMTRHQGGMGMGLAIAKSMVELHGGQIWVESIEGRGSKFSFLLPSGLGSPPERVSAFTLD